jgi:hypothetical protein
VSGPKAVIWDVGNVIVRWSPRTLYSQIFSRPARALGFHVHHFTDPAALRPALEGFGLV